MFSGVIVPRTNTFVFSTELFLTSSATLKSALARVGKLVRIQGSIKVAVPVLVRNTLSVIPLFNPGT